MFNKKIQLICKSTFDQLWFPLPILKPCKHVIYINMNEQYTFDDLCFEFHNSFSW